MKSSVLKLLSGLLLMVLASCQMPQGQTARTVAIRISTSTSRTLVADWTKAATSYEIQLTSAGHGTVSKTLTTTGTALFSDVTAGIWDVSVIARAGVVMVGQGAQAGLVVPESGAASADIVLTGDQTGTGSYRFGFKIPQSVGITAVQGQLYRLDGSTVSDIQTPILTSVGEFTTGTIAGDNVPGGAYRLALAFLRGSTVVGSFSEAVNIWTNVVSDQWLGDDGVLRSTKVYSTTDFASGASTLENLVLSSGAVLAPSFSSSVSSYSLSLPSGDAWTVTPSQSFGGQTIDIQIDGGTWTPLPSAETSEVIAANVGAVSLRVRSVDGAATRLYVLTVVHPGVYYHANGATVGSAPVEPAERNTGDTVTLPGNPGAMAKPGSKFAGWSTSPDGLGTTYAGGAQFTKQAEDKHLYALWIDENFVFTATDTTLALTGTVQEPSGTVVIPAGVTEIHYGFLTFNDLVTGLTLPNTLKVIQQNAFMSCGGLTSVTLPPSLVELDMHAFYYSTITSLTIPASVTILGQCPVDSPHLTAINVDPANPNYRSIDGTVYNKDGTQLITVPPGFAGPLVLPASCTKIGWYAFLGTVMTSFTIPHWVTDLSRWAFQGAGALASLDVDPANPVYSSRDGLILNKVGTTVLTSPYGIEGTVVVPSGVTTLGKDCFVSRQKIHDFSFPASLTTFEQSSLSNCSAVTVTFPSTVTSIGSGVLQSAYWLTSVTIEGTPVLSSSLFAYSYSLAKVRFLSATPPPLAHGVNPFSDAPANLKIQVPAAALETYKTAAEWVRFAAQMEALP